MKAFLSSVTACYFISFCSKYLLRVIMTVGSILVISLLSIAVTSFWTCAIGSSNEMAVRRSKLQYPAHATKDSSKFYVRFTKASMGFLSARRICERRNTEYISSSSWSKFNASSNFLSFKLK